MVTRAIRWWTRRDPAACTPDPDASHPGPDHPDQDRRRPDRSEWDRPDRTPPDRPGPGWPELVVGEPSIRFAYPELPAFFSPGSDPAGPGRIAPPWIPTSPVGAGTTVPVDSVGSAGSAVGEVAGAGGDGPGAGGPGTDPAAGRDLPGGAAGGGAGGGGVAALPGAAAVPPGGPMDLGREQELVRDAVGLVDDQDRLLVDFYSLIFALGGADVIEMFPTDMGRQRREFGRALVQWVSADDPAALAAHLAQLGADHRKFDVEPAHYAVAGEALVAAVRGRTRGRFTAEHEAALRASYGRLASVMIDGALRNVAEPPYWPAEVLAHRRYQDDFAVLTVQPAAPYPYRAGQYTTVELASRPRLWRQMSIASAPRPDNTLDLHVRAVPGGDVTSALVRHTGPGDRLKLGPPRGGALVVEPGTVQGLLCVAAGTGAAPIAAVVESVLGWRRPVAVHAYVGARTAEDLYPVHYLAPRLAGRPGLAVHGVVSGEPDFPGLRGRVEDVVPDLAPWAELGVDVLVAGPTRMMDRTVTNLRRAGVPPARIHFDQYDTTGA